MWSDQRWAAAASLGFQITLLSTGGMRASVLLMSVSSHHLSIVTRGRVQLSCQTAMRSWRERSLAQCLAHSQQAAAMFIQKKPSSFKFSSFLIIPFLAVKRHPLPLWVQPTCSINLNGLHCCLGGK